MTENPLYANLEERIEAIERLGAIWARSGAFKCDRVEQGQAILSFCMGSGITPLEYLATYHNMAGKPQKLALACLAEIRMKGAKHKWLTESDDREKAVLEITFEGATVKVKYTIEDAKAQGLVKADSNWVRSPSYMLRARAITTAIGMLAPEIVAGAEAAPDEAPQVEKPLQLDKPSPEKEEKELADMGLAPATPKPEPATPKPEPAKEKKEPPKRRSISVPAPGEEEGAGPIPPPKKRTIEPEGTAEPPKPVKKVEFGTEELDPALVDQMGHIFQGHFLEVANWMIKEGWIPAPDKSLDHDAFAAHHLRATLPKLTKARARKIIEQKEAFLRAILPPKTS